MDPATWIRFEGWFLSSITTDARNYIWLLNNVHTKKMEMKGKSWWMQQRRCFRGVDGIDHREKSNVLSKRRRSSSPSVWTTNEWPAKMWGNRAGQSIFELDKWHLIVVDSAKLYAMTQNIIDPVRYFLLSPLRPFLYSLLLLLLPLLLFFVFSIPSLTPSLSLLHLFLLLLLIFL